ncbi:MAG TPA: vitamin B12-dependent ribonucleotide reductase [Phycisphaerae bacterium]|nr:vitamin B12-dependent ribonucleotide reductase [Phycisphaerae bacterium]
MSMALEFSAQDHGRRAERQGQDGLRVERSFCRGGLSPFEQVTWDSRTAAIKDEKGKVIFQQDGVEVPSAWSQLATNVVVSKYFYGEVNAPQRESSVRDLIERVAGTIADWARRDGTFVSDADADAFRDELGWLCLNQHGAFNSPVWFNVGLFHRKGVDGSEGNFHWDEQAGGPRKTLRGYEYPQASACFIQSVDDTMEDIMRLAASEAMLFKYGSGTGTDLSTLRSSREHLSGGGTPSGPLSFMRVFDQIAAVIKSGGKTRRAAKMQSLRCDHPDIKEFIECKAAEEKKAWALIDAGYDGDFNGEAYGSIMFQNANLSVRMTDEFLSAAVEDRPWQTYAITTGEPLVEYRAAELLRSAAESCHICGDPGVQYHTTINRWHTCPESGPINASNPCSEYMFVDDSACNLASLNLMKFRRDDGTMDVDALRRAVRIFLIAQETIIDHGSYPTERICRNSHRFRPLGIGYANLGALLMSLGLPYDSEAGRAVAAALTAIITAEAYATSAELAGRLGPFAEFPRSRKAMLNVMAMHRAAVDGIDADYCPPELLAAAREGWDEAVALGQRHGFRNAQASLLAPTGTIGFLMDCDTTGVEPDIALVKYKLLAGGGMFKLVNRTVPLALERLGYTKAQVSDLLEYIEKFDTIEGAPVLRDEHLGVFDCAFKPANGTRSIHYMGHLRMMAAVQPFLSGAISKTVNMPKDCTPEEIQDVFLSGWRMGLKAVAIYRDGSKISQPLNLSKKNAKAQQAPAAEPAPAKAPPPRRRMPDTRRSITHKFDVAGHEGYMTVGLYDEGQPGELFITMAKEGSTVGGMMDAFATAISLCLQYHVPLEALVMKFTHQRFEPSGMTSNPEIPFAKSIVDYVFRWLGMQFLEDYRKANAIRRPAATEEPAARACSEGVKDDISSRMHGAGGVTDKDVTAPGAGMYAPSTSGDSDGGNGKGGNGGSPARTLAAAAERRQVRQMAAIERIDQQFSHFQEDAPACDVCGSITVRNGNCYKCFNCGSSLGCS